jgi:hypothetical protein
MTDQSEGVVYLVQQPPPVRRGSGPPKHKDLSSAQRYGVLRPILSDSDQASATPGPALHQMMRELKSFDPAKDFICYAGGDPMSLAVAAMALANMNIREFTMLRWERERSTDGVRKPGGFYVPIKVPTRT